MVKAKDEKVIQAQGSAGAKGRLCQNQQQRLREGQATWRQRGARPRREGSDVWTLPHGPPDGF